MSFASHRSGAVRRTVAIGVGVVLFVSCGGTAVDDLVDSAEATSVATGPATAGSDTYAIVAGDTLSGIAERAGISLSGLVAANEWADGADHLILPGDVIDLPAGVSVAAPTSAPAQQPAAVTDEPAAAPVTPAEPSSGSTGASTGGYEAIASPQPTSLLTNSKTSPLTDPLPDGEYWSWDYASDGQNVSFTLVQYFVGDACRAQFGDDPDACASDNNTLYSPSATMTLAADARTSVVWCCPNGSFSSYRVSTAEFARLVAGLAPAADAPAGFTYGRAGALVTVRNGQAISAEQIFTS